jgi:hypothetical protein
MLLLTFSVGIAGTREDAASESGRYPGLYEATLESNRYLSLYEDSKANPAYEVTPDFELAAEDDRTALYVKPETLAIRILNKETGYLWSSNLDSYEEERLNATWKAYFESGITIEYYEINAKTQDFKVNQEALLTDEATETTISRLEDGFEAAVHFGESGIELKYRVLLTDRGIEVLLDPADVKEQELSAEEAKKKSPKRLVSVTFFPFLGSTKAGGQDGYFLIPDGDGALVNFKKTYENITSGYQKRYYGSDAGIKLDFNNQEFIKAPKALNYPLYGIVHGVRDNGLFIHIEEGSGNAELLMNPAGVRTDYYYITNRFIFREPYLHEINSTTRSLVMQEAMTKVQVRMGIDLLDGEEADYLGIAKHYRSLLGEKDMLPKNAASKEVPLMLNALMSSVKPGIFFNNIVPMTTIGQLRTIASQLKASGVNRTIVSAAGMFKDTITVSAKDRFRLKWKLGGLQELTDLAKSMSDGGDLLTVEMDYFAHHYKSYADIEPKTDLIYMMNRNYLYFEHNIGLKKVKSTLLNSQGFEKYVKADEKKLMDLGIRGITVNLPFGSSSYGALAITREASFAQIADTLQNARALVGGVYIYQDQGTPSIIAGASGMKNIAMETSLFPYITDSIPFTAIVYHGSIDLFSQTLNTIGDPDVRKLKMVEWGIYPAFDLTYEDPEKLLYSDDWYLVSSRYSDWKKEILETYSFVEGALKYVTGETITGHRVLATGVVQVTYGNQVSIVVNYTEQAYQSGNLNVAPGSYEVIQP